MSMGTESVEHPPASDADVELRRVRRAHPALDPADVWETAFGRLRRTPVGAHWAVRAR